MRKILFPLFLGISGCAILISLCIWQINRLAEKEGILDEIDGRLAGAARPLTLDVVEDSDEYTRVTFAGMTTGEELHVLVSGTSAGSGYRVISEFQTDQGTKILLDQGLLPWDAKETSPLITDMKVTGTLLWPDDQNSSTPNADLEANIWYARNVTNMAEVLGTEPLMVVVTHTQPQDPRLTPLPVGTANIKNDHLEYAITWFLLAVVWAIMTVFLIIRTTRQKEV